MNFEKKYYEMAMAYYTEIKDDNKLFEFVHKLNELNNSNAMKLATLSKTENIILTLILAGYTTIHMASIQYVSVGTIKKHISNILYKLNCKNQDEIRRRFS